MSSRINIYSLAAMLGLASTFHASAQQNASRVINYQGGLANPDGSPFIDGNYPMTFRIYEVPTAGAALWEEVMAAPVPVLEGRFNVSLGAGTPALPPSAFTGSARYLEIIVDGTTIEPRQVIASAPYAMHAYNGVPIGTVIDWWRPGGSDLPVPEGFKVCDGTEVTDEESPYLGTQVPDLRNKFVRGASNLASINASGGNDSITIAAKSISGTAASAGAHRHSIDPPSTATSSAGAHYHRWLVWDQSYPRFNTWNKDGGYTILNDYQGSNGFGGEGSGSYLIRRTASQGDISYYTQSAGNHTHSVNVAPFNSGSTGAHTHAVSATVPASTVPNVPAYLGLLKLIKIK